MPIVDTVQFAKELKVSKQRVMDGIKTGLLKTSLTVTKKGTRNTYKIDLEAGLAEWASNIDPSKQRDSTKQLETKDMNGKGSEPSQYQRAKAVKETYGAKLAQLDYEEKAGKLISAALVKAEAFKISRNVRDSLMGLPERVSAELAAMTEPREIAIYLRSQLSDALRDLQGVENAGQPRR